MAQRAARCDGQDTVPAAARPDADAIRPWATPDSAAPGQESGARRLPAGWCSAPVTRVRFWPPSLTLSLLPDSPCRSGGRALERSFCCQQSQREAVEMPGLWKAWKAKGRLPPLSTSPLGISPKAGEIPTFPQLRRRGRMEKWKTKSRFPTFPPPRIYIDLKDKNQAARAGFALRPAASAPRRLRVKR